VCREFGVAGFLMTICNETVPHLSREKCEAYRAIWRTQQPPRPPESLPAEHEFTPDLPNPCPPGVGTELTRILTWFNFKSSEGHCQCKERAKRMDCEGIEWCENNRGLIIDWLREGATKLGVPFYESAARGALRAAIWNAKRKYRQ
jgi:hypothetical protein